MNKPSIKKHLSALVISLLLCYSSAAQAKRERHEREYQTDWCDYATEVRLRDGARVDCLTPFWAVEIDFADKWAECIGQSLYYANKTGKHPACVLIIETPGQCKYIDRFKSAAAKQNIQLWLIGKSAPSCTNFDTEK